MEMLDVEPEPPRKKFKMDESSGKEEKTDLLKNSMDLLMDESPDIFAESELVRQLSGDGSSAGLEIEDLPRTDVTVGSQFPPAQPGDQHAVLADLHSLRKDKVPDPYPKRLEDRWDSRYVRMPWSSESKYPVTVDGKERILKRWDVICESLSCLKSLDHNSDSAYLADTIRNAILSYNKRFVDNTSWTFKVLKEFLEDLEDEAEMEMFYSRILPGMVELCLSGPQAVTGAIPLLTCQKTGSVTLSQHQISVLLANAFFCTFPRRNNTSRKYKEHEYKNYPDINFNRMLSNCAQARRAVAHQEKLKTIFAYFRRVIQNTPKGLVTFHRQVMPNDDKPDWNKLHIPLPENHLRLASRGYIEKEGQGMLQADFANKFIGGGVLGQGLVQEEIRFIICPDLIISRLFIERLEENEVVFIHGAEQFSKYRGYSDEYRYDGVYEDKTPCDIQSRRNTTVLAMDATSFMRDTKVQYELKRLERELNKAYLGFLPLNDKLSKLNAVATGNWGCGAFGGDPEFKFLIQVLASVSAKRKLCYFTFGDKQLVRNGWSVYQSCVSRGVTVGQLFNFLKNYQYRQKRSQTVFQYIQMRLDDENGGESNYDVDTDEETSRDENLHKSSKFVVDNSSKDEGSSNVRRKVDEVSIKRYFKEECTKDAQLKAEAILAQYKSHQTVTSTESKADVKQVESISVDVEVKATVRSESSDVPDNGDDNDDFKKDEASSKDAAACDRSSDVEKMEEGRLKVNGNHESSHSNSDVEKSENYVEDKLDVEDNVKDDKSDDVPDSSRPKSNQGHNKTPSKASKKSIDKNNQKKITEFFSTES